jgi:hypothetical protein
VFAICPVAQSPAALGAGPFQHFGPSFPRIYGMSAPLALVVTGLAFTTVRLQWQQIAKTAGERA